MKKWFPILAAGIMALSLATNADAARRFGGGMSFGRPAPTQMAPMNRGAAPTAPAAQKPAAAPQQQKAAPAGAGAAAPKPASPLRGMLMGAAAALGIAALAHWLGIGSELGTILLMALVALAAVTLLKMIFSRRQQPKASAAGMPGMQAPREPEYREPVRPQASQFQASGARAGSVLDEFSGSGAQAAQQEPLPLGFDQYGFLEECKKNFAVMQDAWCTGNVLKLSEFCTDDVFTEITHQLKDRKGEALTISIQSLSAELSGFAKDGTDYVAAVHFTGSLDVSGELEEVNEVWSLSRPVADSTQGWLLAGISQVD